MTPQVVLANSSTKILAALSMTDQNFQKRSIFNSDGSLDICSQTGHMYVNPQTAH